MFLKSRKAILKKLRGVLEERMQKQAVAGRKDESDRSDLLGFVLENSNLNAEQIGDLLLGLIFGGHETTTTSIVLTIYYLHDCPEALEQLREEHEDLVRNKKERGEAGGLTWDDYKKMSFTQCVISEALRLGNIIKMIRKKASKDVHFKGYDIPSGWSVILLLVSAHMDSSMYEDPKKFDPWRWKRNPQSTAYMPFGQGLRKCPGQELARIETAIFLHHLVLNFDWELAEPDHPVGYAIPQFMKGLPIKVQRRRRSSGTLSSP
ncbi:Cytochrome P450 90B1 [Platanthera zijinensis]|uniref:Cytochrome P450 90B1 n=1 Tax=Platanthera zijinensis TaxID=2320716 RepID=A0AAP0BDW5_9ASPA